MRANTHIVPGPELLLLLLLLSLSFPLMSHAATITVDLNDGGDFLSIQPAVDASVSGDTVLVFPGTYYGAPNRDIHFYGKAITLCSRDGMDATIIDQEYDPFRRAFMFDGNEGRDTVVDGFTVTRTVDEGCGGFMCYYSSPTIRNCRFERCWAYGEIHAAGDCGAGMVYSGNALFEDCVFEGNSADGTCGGVCVSEHSNAVFRRCLFADNRDNWEGVGAVRVSTYSTATFEGCTFTDHTSERVFSVGYVSQLVLIGCTVARNATDWSTLMDTHETSTVSVSNSILAFNDCDSLIIDGPNITFTHCCLYQTGADTLYQLGRRESNLRADPLFCGLQEGDLTLCANSPCLPAHNPWSETIGALGEGCPPCSSPVEAVSWGTIKAMYR